MILNTPLLECSTVLILNLILKKQDNFACDTQRAKNAVC